MKRLISDFSRVGMGLWLSMLVSVGLFLSVACVLMILVDVGVCVGLWVVVLVVDVQDDHTFIAGWCCFVKFLGEKF